MSKKENNMTINSTPFSENWDNCVRVDNKSEQDLIDEGIASDGVLSKATPEDVNKVINTAVKGETVKLRMNLDLLPNAYTRRHVYLHCLNNKIFGKQWDHMVVHEFTQEFVNTPEVQAHFAEFGFEIIK